MRIRTNYLLLLSFISAYICGCTKISSEQVNLNAVLWIQTSSEYAAATIGTYAAATGALQRAVAADATGIDRMAVVMDLDETVLDNSRYKAQVVLTNVGRQFKTWDQWIALREATAVPGAVDFIRASQELGVSVFFITNRKCRDRADNSGDCPQKEDTLINLQQLGVEIDRGALLLKSERPPDRCLSLLSESEHEQGRRTASDKTSRRRCVGLDHDIIMLVGDQLNDFIGDPGNATLASREELLQQHKEKWGKTWFLIPNPTDGAWLKHLQPDKRAHLRGL